LPHEWTYWECASGTGNIVNVLRQADYRIFGSDITTGTDFLSDPAPEPFDAIITNPPFSAKTAFLERAYALGKPFAFLLPLSALETRTRQALFRTYGVRVLFVPKRVRYEDPQGKPTRP
jgi:hypothetical protein